MPGEHELVASLRSHELGKPALRNGGIDTSRRSWDFGVPQTSPWPRTGVTEAALTARCLPDPELATELEIRTGPNQRGGNAGADRSDQPLHELNPFVRSGSR